MTQGSDGKGDFTSTLPCHKHSSNTIPFVIVSVPVSWKLQLRSKKARYRVILILSNTLDVHADVVCSHLEKRGQPYVRFHPSTFPLTTSITMIPGQRTTIEHQLADREHTQIWQLSDITSVWFRRPERATAPIGCTREDAEFATKESDYFLRALYHELSDRRWLNTPQQIAGADWKPDQLAVAASVGLSTPRTIITNDPNAALSFFDSCPGEVIYKQLSAYSRYCASDGRRHTIYTNILAREDLVNRAESISAAPCLLQEYVKKQSELRVTIVGKNVFAAEINSQASERSRIDWRHYDIPNTPYRAVELPQEVQTGILMLLSHYNLAFGCIDLVLTPEGQYVFLELNPNGQWYWVEALTGLPIAKHITDYLVQD